MLCCHNQLINVNINTDLQHCQACSQFAFVLTFALASKMDTRVSYGDKDWDCVIICLNTIVKFPLGFTAIFSNCVGDSTDTHCEQSLCFYVFGIMSLQIRLLSLKGNKHIILICFHCNEVMSNYFKVMGKYCLYMARQILTLLTGLQQSVIKAKYSGAQIIRIKISEKCVQIKQNVQIIEGSHYPGSTVHLTRRWSLIGSSSTFRIQAVQLGECVLNSKSPKLKSNFFFWGCVKMTDF